MSLKKFKYLLNQKAEKKGIRVEEEDQNSWIFKMDNLSVSADISTIYEEHQKHGDQVIEFMFEQLESMNIEQNAI